MSKSESIQQLKSEFLDLLYSHKPDLMFHVIDQMTMRWGYKRKKVVGPFTAEEAIHQGYKLPDGYKQREGKIRITLHHERDVAMEFINRLSKFLEGQKPQLLKQPGSTLWTQDEWKQVDTWVERWSGHPYENAIQEFTAAVFQWLLETDLRNEITDDSSDHFVFYLKQWWIRVA